MHIVAGVTRRVCMQLFRARKLLHSALIGLESGMGEGYVASKGISSKYLQTLIDILLDQWIHPDASIKCLPNNA